MTTIASLQDRYAEVRQRVAQAAQRSGRNAEEILLVAVTKYAEPDQVRALVSMGHQDFGENKVQRLQQQAAMLEELRDRQRLLTRTAHKTDVLGSAESDLRWHMIGHLQRNKARKAVEYCRLIHTLDSLRLAEELQTIALRQERTIDVLVQVNCSGEEGKHGCLLPAAIPLAEQIDTMVYVRVRGVMTMAPYATDPELARPAFERARDVLKDMAKAGIGDGACNLLSMGMSGDYEVAIEEGANIVRVGSALFSTPE